MRDTALNYPRSDSLMGLIMRRCARACMGKVQRFNLFAMHVEIRYDRIAILSSRNKRINPSRIFAPISNLSFLTLMNSREFQ